MKEQLPQLQDHTHNNDEGGYSPLVIERMQACRQNKDHIAAALLALFLGAFGAHKFYLGYTKAGFIMLGMTVIGSLCTFGLALWAMMAIGWAEALFYFGIKQSDFEQAYVLRRREWF